MRNVLRRPRNIVVATALAGSLMLGIAAAAHADFSSPRNTASTPSVAPTPSAKVATAEETAEATMATEAATCSTTYLSYGSRGTCVKLLQKNLGGLSVNGVYGSGTRSRVRSFQDDAGLTVDGKVGPQTWRKLRTYGKAVGWVSGVTVYMCKESSERFRYSTWNNSGRSAHWSFYTSTGRFEGDEIRDDRIAVVDRLQAGAYTSTSLMVWLGINDLAETNATVRSFSRNTLPACG
jgi:peptidoglycan hydrolase-like protein with peptidoglycan-binding domain